MNTLPKKLLAFIRGHGVFPSGASVLCALSGGADSVALLAALLALRETLGLGTVAAAHFNHQLRGGAADADEAFARALCERLEAPFYVGRADVSAEANRRRAGIEETAREMRYAFLEQTAAQAGCIHIATGHTADDNVETVLLHLVRGAGLSGLTGIPPVRGNIVRPLLTCTREEVETFLAVRGLPHIEDATNQDISLARNRIRRRVIPELRSLNPRLSGAVSGLSARLRQDESYLLSQAESEVTQAVDTPAGVSFPASHLAALPAALAARVCGLLFARAAGRDDPVLSSAHIAAILRLCAGNRPSASVTLPCGLLVRRDYDMVIIGPPLSAPPPLSPQPLMPGCVCRLPAVNCQLSMINCQFAKRSEPYHFFLTPATIRGGLVVRTRRPGDALTLPGKPGGKSLKRLMIDAKIPVHLRDVWPVIADETGVAAVPGLGVAASYRAKPGTEAVEVMVNRDKES